MEFFFDEAFEKSIRKLSDRKVKDRIIKLIDRFGDIKDLTEITNIKKLQGFKSFYRIRIGDYRVGLELQDDNSVLFIIVAHRKEIYRYFP
jgi:mRNA interferase RelE/StbE